MLAEPLLEPMGEEPTAGRRRSRALVFSASAVVGVTLLAFSRHAIHLQHPTASAVLDDDSLLAHPLREFVKRSAQRGACELSGAPRGFPVPWAMTLATAGRTSSSAPAMRSIGIQGVVGEEIVFVCRGGPGGAFGPPAGLAQYSASMTHLAGNYPGAAFEEQWRAEGVIREIPLATLRSQGLPPPDPALVAQILGAAAFTARHVQRQGGSPAPATGEGRLVLTHSAGDDAEALARETTRGEAAAELGTPVEEEEAYRAGLRAYALTPQRMELLRGGPDWPAGPLRHEWVRLRDEDGWRRSARVLPYSWPQ